MSSNDAIGFKLDKIPSNDNHIVADVIELLCLINLDGIISKADAITRVRELKKMGGTDPNESSGTDVAAQIDDKWEQKGNDWFSYLEHRAKKFGTSYPFKYKDEHDTLELKQRLYPNHRLYIFILLCSFHNNFNKSSKLQGFFEQVSYLALKKYLPSQSEIHHFGSNPTLAFEDSFGSSNKLEDRVRGFAEQVNEEVVEHTMDFREGNTGDGGVDLIAWIPFNDNVNGMIIILAQCTCSINWDGNDKDLEATSVNFKYIHFTEKPNSMLFIPFCYRKAKSEWFLGSEVSGIVVDRYRISHLLNGAYDELIDPAKEFVEFIVDYEESLF